MIPLIIKFCTKYGWYDQVNSRKVHSGNIPRLGSAGFVPVFLAVSMRYLASEALLPAYLPIFAGGALIFTLGLLDDRYELRPRYKLLGQCVASLIPLVFGLRLTAVGPVNLGVLGYGLTFVWLIGMSNAFNLIDGVDALCGSLSLSVALTLGVVVYLAGAGETGLGAVGFILGGSVVGFLVYNKPRARIFMGDGGSQFLGFMLGSLPLLLKSPPDLGYNGFPMVVVLSSIPLLDTVAAIWRRTREGRSFFTPDKRHLHHKLMEMGYTTKSVLGLLVTIQAGLCGVSILAVVWIGGVRGFIVLGAGLGVMILFFAIMHYTSHAISRVKGKSPPSHLPRRPSP